MRGTRYGDFSRFITGLRPRQTALLMQQGRVQLDADWNAQAELAGRRLSGAIADILGGSGTPATDPGFEIRPREQLEFSGHGAILTRRRLTFGPSGTASFTIEMRVRWAGGAGTLVDLTDERGERGERREREEHGERGHRGGQLRLSVRNDGTLVFSQQPRDGGAQPRPRELISEEPLTADETAHVAVVCRDGEVSIWVNSRPASQHPLRIAPAGERLVLIGGAPGTRGHGQGHYFTGVIGDARIWGTARPAGELGAPVPGDRPLPRELLAWWPLDGPAAAGLEERVSGEHATPDGATPPRWQLTGLEVAPGRFYVAGHMVALDEPLLLPARPSGAGTGAPLAPGRHIVYLEVWEESVSAAQYPALTEPALGGLDSVVGTELAFRVGWVAAPRHHDERPERLLSSALPAARAGTTGSLAAGHHGQPVTGNWLYRVEVHRGGHTEAELTEVAVTVDLASGTVTLGEVWTGRGQARGEAEFLGVAPDGEQVTVRHTVEPAGGPHQRTLRVVGGAAQLARLRDLRLRQPAPQPTFKWSRNNGADTITVTAVRDQPASFHVIPGPVPPPSPAHGQVVETLGQHGSGDAGQPGTLRHVVAYDSGTHQLTLDGDLPGAGARQVRLRLWDQAAGSPAPDGTAPDEGVPLTTGDWIELEHGVRVRFQPGYYRAGDYWWVPVRQDSDAVLWDRPGGHPRFREPDGVERCHAPLALIEVGDRIRVRDLRGWLRPVVRPAALEVAVEGAEEVAEEVIEDAGAAPEDLGELEELEETAAAPGPPAPGGAGAGPAGGGEDHYDDEVDGPAIPSGFALLGPAGATAAGWRSTGVAVAVKRAWTAPVPLALPDAPAPMALVPAGSRLLLITATDIWTVDPGSGEVAHRAALPEPRTGFGCAAVGDTILLLGGRRPGAERADGRVLSFDVGRGSWLTGRRPLVSPVDDPAVAVTAGGAPRVHVLGGAGERGERASRRHQVYDPAGDQWTAGPPLRHARKAAAAGAAGGAVYLFGGTARRRGEEEPLSSADVYNEQARTWSEGPPLPAAGAVALSAAGGGQLIAAVAPAPGQALSVAALDAEAGVWAGLPYPPRRVQSPVLALHEGRLLLAGVVPPGAGRAGQAVLMTLPPEQGWFLFEQQPPREASR
jgi:hypothetical protein